jgi:hypothetical protein
VTEEGWSEPIEILARPPVNIVVGKALCKWPSVGFQERADLAEEGQVTNDSMCGTISETRFPSEKRKWREKSPTKENVQTDGLSIFLCNRAAINGDKQTTISIIHPSMPSTQCHMVRGPSKSSAYVWPSRRAGTSANPTQRISCLADLNIESNLPWPQFVGE